MRILDWYIIRRFLGTFFFILLLLMSIAVIFDVSEKIDDFVANAAPVGAILVDYYLNFVAYYGILFSPLIIFIAVILFTSKMAQDVEVVAIISAGISFNRFLLPYFIGATILAMGALYLNHFVLPKANYDRLAFEEDYIRNPFKLHEKNVHREISPGMFVYFEGFSYTSNIANEFCIEVWDNDRMLSKMTALTAEYNPETDRWLMKKVISREFKGQMQQLNELSEMDTTFPFKPKDFAQRLNVSSTMNYAELTEYIKNEELKGSNKVVFYEIEKHQRTSYPFATYVLTLIGVSLASRKSRGGIGVHLVLGLVTVMIYIFAMKISTVAATNAGLDPLIAVWVPNFVFAGLALVLYRFAQK